MQSFIFILDKVSSVNSSSEMAKKKFVKPQQLTCYRCFTPIGTLFVILERMLGRFHFTAEYLEM